MGEKLDYKHFSKEDNLGKVLEIFKHLKVQSEYSQYLKQEHKKQVQEEIQKAKATGENYFDSIWNKLENYAYEGLTKEDLKEIRDETPQPKESFSVDYEDLKKKEILTRQEVLEFLGVSLSTLQRWTAKGVLKPIGIESRVYYRFSDIIDVLVELR